MRKRRNFFRRYVTLDSFARDSAMMVVEQAIEPRDSHPLRHLEKYRQDLRGHPRIAESAMPSLLREPEMSRQQIEPAALERRHEPSRHPERAQNRVAEPDSKNSAKFKIEKSEIEGRVVRDDHAVAQELAKRRQHVLNRRRLANHLGRNRRQPRDESRHDAALRPNQLREGLGQPLTNHSVGADFNDIAGTDAASGGFQINHRELGLVEFDAEAIALRKSPLRRVRIENEIRIAVENLANQPRTQFRIRTDSAEQQPDQLARIRASRPRAQEMIKLLLGRKPELSLIPARYYRFLHRRLLRPFFALAGECRNSKPREEFTKLNVKPAVGFTLPSAGVTPFGFAQGQALHPVIGNRGFGGTGFSL